MAEVEAAALLACSLLPSGVRAGPTPPHPPTPRKPGSRWYYAEWGRLAECGSAREVSWFLPRPLSASCPSSTEVSFLPWTLAPRAAPHLRGLRAGIRDTRWRWCSASLSRSRPARRPWPRPRTPDRADARTALQLRRADAVRRPDRTGLRPAECPPRLRLASRAPEDLRQTTGNAPVERSGERRGGARLGPPGPRRTGQTRFGRPLPAPLGPGPRREGRPGLRRWSVQRELLVLPGLRACFQPALGLRRFQVLEVWVLKRRAN